MFKKDQMLILKTREEFLKSINYHVYSNGDVKKVDTKIMFNHIMQNYPAIKCPITTNNNYFKFDGWYWYNWMFKGIEKEDYLLDIE